MSDQDAQLLAHVLHDLKNPLSIILCYAEIIPDAKNSEQREYCERMRANARVLLELLDGFGLLADLRSGRVEVSRERCDLMKLAMTVVADLDSVAKLRDQRLTCETGCGGPVPLDRQTLTVGLRYLILEVLRVAPVGATVCVRAATDASGASLQIAFTEATSTAAPDVARLFDLNRPGIELVQRVAALHGGSVSFSAEQRSVTAGIQFPVS